MNKIKLFISVFKSDTDIDGDILAPVSAGAALYDNDDPKLELCDDAGDNISGLNPQYCELTVQYWAWKNCSFDFGGIMHQRRYFDFSDASPYAYDNNRRSKKTYRIFDEPDAETLRRLKTDHAVSFTKLFLFLQYVRYGKRAFLLIQRVALQYSL